MKLLDELTFKILDSSLFALAYERKNALETIFDHCRQLATNMMLLQHCTKDCKLLQDLNRETSLLLAEIGDCTRLYEKEYQLTIADLADRVWEGPLGEYYDYKHLYSRMIRKLTELDYPQHAILPPSEQTWLKLKQKYWNAFELMVQIKFPDYDLL